MVLPWRWLVKSLTYSIKLVERQSSTAILEGRRRAAVAADCDQSRLGRVRCEGSRVSMCHLAQFATAGSVRQTPRHDRNSLLSKRIRPIVGYPRLRCGNLSANTSVIRQAGLIRIQQIAGSEPSLFRSSTEGALRSDNQPQDINSSERPGAGLRTPPESVLGTDRFGNPPYELGMR
jgi:hypothetical protein